MGGQSKSIKSFNSGQGLGDPSPQGDPDNHQILLFRRWHVYELFRPMSLFGHSETQSLCLHHRADLLPFFFKDCQLACFLFCFSSRVGQDVALLFDIHPSWQDMYLCLVKPEKFQPNPVEKTWGIWQRKKRKLTAHWIKKNKLTGSNFEVLASRRETFFFFFFLEAC